MQIPAIVNPLSSDYNGLLLLPWKKENYVNLPDRPDHPLPKNIEPYSLFQKLTIRGISPQDIKRFDHMWIRDYVAGRKNYFFDGEDAVFSKEKERIYNQIPEERNLVIFVTSSEEEAEEYRSQPTSWSHWMTCLTINQVIGDEPLPDEFIEFIIN